MEDAWFADTSVRFFDHFATRIVRKRQTRRVAIVRLLVPTEFK